MNYGVAIADGGMLAHKGETMNETVTETTNPLPCACCKQPVTRPSMGGWGICGLCDTGYCGGKQGHAYAQGFIDELAEVNAALRASRERLRSLANTWESQADYYPADAVAQYAAAAVRLCARELRAALGEEATS